MRSSREPAAASSLKLPQKRSSPVIIAIVVSVLGLVIVLAKTLASAVSNNQKVQNYEA